MSVLEKAPLAPVFDDRSVVTPAGESQLPYNLGLGYLRAFITVLVVAHHAVLAYHPFATVATSMVAQPRWWGAFPVVDTMRWNGFALLAGFNDTFFMSLMFFISGLFLWKSLQRKGSARFLKDRVLRLGLPFAVAAAMLAPLAYYPTYLQTSRQAETSFWQQWFRLGNWPAGPAWFAWVLLAFDCIAVLAFALLPRWSEAVGRVFSRAGRHPALFFGLLVASSALVYVPMALIFNPFSWVAIGPFFFQTSRIFHYLIYFLIAVGIGSYGIDSGLLASSGKLARGWPLWAVGGLAVFGLASSVAIKAMASQDSPYVWGTLAGLAFTLSCATTCLAFLALFVRFARRPNRVCDSLRDNAYAIYLIHYAFVSWLQYGLLKAQLSAPVKGLVVFVCALALSWRASAALRRIPVVARVI